MKFLHLISQSFLGKSRFLQFCSACLILILFFFVVLPSCMPKGAPTASDVYRKLVHDAIGLEDHPAFRYEPPKSGLKNVLIYGDSISIGYTEHVRLRLKGLANVYRIHDNGSDSGSMIKKIKQLETAMRQDRSSVDPWNFDWDVILFNVGLHDLKYLNNQGQLDLEGKVFTKIENYKENLSLIYSYLNKNYPKTIFIFALTTPVPNGAQGRKKEDVEYYNIIARQTYSNKPNLYLLDLYNLALPNMGAWLINATDVHYNEKRKYEIGRGRF